MLFRRLFLWFAVAVFSFAVPAFAHDLPIGGSRWAVGNNSILGFIDLKSSLMREVKVIKEGHYDVDSLSSDQLQRIATDVLQPYVNQTVSVSINGKTYPVKVTKLTKNDNYLFTLWVTVSNVSFDQPENAIKLSYSMLSDETRHEHVSLAFGYVTNATGDALQTVFNTAPPAFQTVFDANNQVWDFSVKGAAPAPAAARTGGSPANTAHTDGGKNPAPQSGASVITAKSVAAPASGSPQQELKSSSAISTGPSLSEPPSGGKADIAASQEPVKGSFWPTVRLFVPLGIEHILTGYDHIAFLLGIIVIELSIREILKIITAFTVAHSITLLLAASGTVSLNSRLVECVIAFSICYVALENIFRKKVHYRWLITFGFGLIHGFGFASALRELLVGKTHLLLSVLCFNTGVEMGQLMLFFLLLPILYLLKKQLGYRLVTVGASAVIFVTGFGWLMERAFRLRLLGL